LGIPAACVTGINRGEGTRAWLPRQSAAFSYTSMRELTREAIALRANRCLSGVAGAGGWKAIAGRCHAGWRTSARLAAAGTLVSGG